ncbi:MAG TPA: VOC family protein [Thermoanaerobaculia bacterium]
MKGISRRGLLAVFFLVVLGLVCLACATAPRPQGKGGSPMTDLSRIDHVILGIGDLQKGTAELERLTGVRAVFGGAHPGRGTQNALISLGGNHYLEILAPNPEERGNRDADELRGLTALTPIGWAVRSEDLPALQQRLRSRGVPTGEIRPGGRNLPDGTRLAWKTLAYGEPSSPLLPFFIDWGRGGAHPSATSPGGCRLAGLSLQDPAPDTLRQPLEAAGLQVEVREGREPRIRLSLVCPQGDVELP